MSDGSSSFPGKLRTKGLIKCLTFCIRLAPRSVQSRRSVPHCSKFWSNTKKMSEQTREVSGANGPSSENLGLRSARLARDCQLSHAVFSPRPLGTDRGDDALFHLEDFCRFYRF